MPIGRRLGRHDARVDEPHTEASLAERSKRTRGLDVLVARCPSSGRRWGRRASCRTRGGGRCGTRHWLMTMPCPMPPCDGSGARELGARAPAPAPADQISGGSGVLSRGSALVTALGRWEPCIEAHLAEGPKWARCLDVSEAGCPTRGRRRWGYDGGEEGLLQDARLLREDSRACVMPPRPPSIRGGSRADSMVGLTALTENPAGYRTTCVSREICAQGMCATCNTIAGVTAKFYNVHGVGHR